jgi:hypothetical protein
VEAPITSRNRYELESRAWFGTDAFFHHFWSERRSFPGNQVTLNVTGLP